MRNMRVEEEKERAMDLNVSLGDESSKGGEIF